MSAFLTAFAQFLDSGRWLNLLFLLAGTLMLGIMVRIQFGHNGIDFKDYLRGDDGKTSPTMGFMLGCFLATTWGFVVLVNKGLITEWYFNGYILLWAANRLGTKWMDFQRELKLGRTPDPAQPSAVNAQVPAGSTATLTVTPSGATQ